MALSPKWMIATYCLECQHPYRNTPELCSRCGSQDFSEPEPAKRYHQTMKQQGWFKPRLERYLYDFKKGPYGLCTEWEEEYEY